MDTELLLKTIKIEAERINSYLRQDLQSLKNNVDPLLFELLDYGIFNGGKRIRPLLVVFASRFCGVDDENLYRLACAFEYLHCATLFHDDIIDGSAIRRGKAAVHIKYGVREAILAGDFLHAHSMALVGQYTGKEAFAVFCNVTTGMVDGEFLQIRREEKREQSLEEYYETIIGKTALLISAACEIGGMYAGCDESVRIALRQYGNQLGCAFQIIDDVLDYTGKSEKTGKALGQDLVEGKITLPLILAAQRVQGREKERLAEILASKEQRESCFTEVSSMLMEHDCFSLAKEKAKSLVNTGLESLQLCPGGDTAEREFFENLAQFIVMREK